MVPLPQWMNGLTPEMVRRAEMELGETPATRKQCLEELRQLIEAEKGFGPLMEERFLIRFLRVRKYNVKKAFKTLKNYYDFKHKYSGTTTDLTPTQISKILEMDKVFVSPKRDLNGGGIMIVFPGTFDVEKATAYDFMAAVVVGAEVGKDTDASQVCGSSLIFDFQGITFSKLKHFSMPSFLAMAVRGIQDCLPYRMNAFHIVNEPNYFNYTYNIIRPMLSRKFRERVHFHGNNLESLHAFIPPESLPKQLGGVLGQEDFDEYRSLIYSKETFIEKLNTYVLRGQSYGESEKQDNRIKDELIIETLDDIKITC